MKISVVVPTFNGGEGLIKLFESLQAQSLDGIEVIFVDDASDDEKSLAILDDLDEFDNVRVVYLEDNSGFPGRGRNIGLNLARGDYVIFSDQDDTYNPDAFEKMYEEITKNKSDMLIANFNQINQGNITPFNSGINNKLILKTYKDNEDIFQLPAAIWTRLFKREFLINNNISFLEDMLCEDVYVATLANFKANNIIYIPDLYAYNYSIRDSPNDKSTIHLRNTKYVGAILEGYIEISKWLDLNKPEYGRDVFKKHLTSWLHTIVLSEITDEDRFKLFKKSKPVFKKWYVEDDYFKGKYKKLAKYILNEDFEKAVKESRKQANENIFKKIKNKILR